MVEHREQFWPVYNADEPSPAGGVPLARSTLLLAAPGNHDTDTRDPEELHGNLAYFYYWDQPLNGPLGKEGGPFVPTLDLPEEFRKGLIQSAGDAYPRMTNFSFDYGNSHWTVIDSNPYVDWTDRALKEWVSSDLAKPRKGMTLAVCRVPAPRLQSQAPRASTTSNSTCGLLARSRC